MRMVAETEAEGQLPHLLDQVELGEAIGITRDGRPIAALTPMSDVNALRSPRQKYTPGEVRAAMLRIREQAKAAGQKFDWEEVKRWRDEGRR
jgi:prevent-host-death family protein